MLVLSRKTDESLKIGDDIVITVVAVQGGKVRIGIDAPKEVKVLRSELADVIAGNGPRPVSHATTRPLNEAAVNAANL